MYTVCHDRSAVFPKQSKLIIRISVKLRFRTKLLHPCDLSIIFREMGLHRQLIFHLNRFQFSHQFICTARNKTRSQDRLCILIVSLLHLFDPRNGLFCTFFCLFTKIVWGIPVHIHLTDHCIHSCLFKQIHKQQRSIFMKRCKNTGSCCRTFSQILHKNLICRLCIFRIFIL